MYPFLMSSTSYNRGYLTFFDVAVVDGDVLVAVGPLVLVPEAKCMHDLMDDRAQPAPHAARREVDALVTVARRKNAQVRKATARSQRM